MKNIGKIFEQQIQKSVPEYALLYRVSDSAQAFGGNSSLRFSSKNPFDFILWDSMRHVLYALELKTVAGKSISFERTEEDRGEIHRHQIEGLGIWNEYDGTVCGFLIEFRALETTIFLEISEFNKLISEIQKKSFNYTDLSKHSIKYFIVPQKKLRTKYLYDVGKLLQQEKLSLEENKE